MRQIEDVGQRIGREFGAERVILFGSYAQGPVTGDSDIDLLVVVNHIVYFADKYGKVIYEKLQEDCF